MGTRFAAGRFGRRLSGIVPMFLLLSCAEGLMGEGGRSTDEDEPSAFPVLNLAEGPRDEVAIMLPCQGAPDDDGDACTDDVCVPEVGETYHFPVVTDDADACTIDACDSVQGVVRTELDCDDGSVCTNDGCHADVGCFHSPVVYFNETFSEGDRWNLEGFGITSVGVGPNQEQDTALQARFDGPASMVVATANLEVHPLSGAWLRYAYTVPPAHATLRVELHAEGEWIIVDEITGTDPTAAFPDVEPSDVGWHVTTLPINAQLDAGALIRFAVLIDEKGTLSGVSGEVLIDDVKVLPDPSCP